MLSSLNTLLANCFQLDIAHIHDDLDMQSCAAWDSLTHMKLITALEQDLKIELSLDDIVAMTSINAIRHIVNEKTHEHRE